MNLKNSTVVILATTLALEPLIEHKNPEPHAHTDSPLPMHNPTAVKVYGNIMFNQANTGMTISRPVTAELVTMRNS